MKLNIMTALLTIIIERNEMRFGMGWKGASAYGMKWIMMVIWMRGGICALPIRVAGRGWDCVVAVVITSNQCNNGMG